MCSCGTGLWRANFTWGDDLTDPDYYQPLVCTEDNPLATEGCNADWHEADKVRDMGREAGLVSIAAILFLSLATFFGWRHVPGFGDPINAKRAFQASAIAFVLQFVAHAWFSSSPLFKDLSYNFGCHFVFVHPLNSNSLVCHALGPGWALSAVGLILTGVGAILYFFAYYPTEYVNPSTGRYSLFTEMFERKLDKQRHVLMARNESEPPVDDSTAIRRFVRAYGIPLLCMGNFALFLYSNISTGATVEPHIRLEFPNWLASVVKAVGIKLKDGSVLEFRDDVFNFTLVSSLRHFWSSKSYALAFLIGAFSGVWPYAKVFGMLMLWFVPASERLRGRALHWIDLLGKWSLIDSFFLCLMCVGFGFDTTVNILGIQIAVNIKVRPGWGVYSFVIATIWSLALSHYLTYVHQRAIERRTWTRAFLSSMKDPPLESLGTRPYAPLVRRRRFKCRKFGRVLVWWLLLCAFCITLAGQITKTFRFTFGGLAKLILSPEKQVTDYSMISIGEAIPDAAREGGYLSGEGWNWFLAVQFFFLAMAMPLFRVLLLMVLWAVPMSLKNAKRLHDLAHVVAAWAAMDVFLVAIIAAVMEIGKLSAEVISSAFGPLEATLCEVIELLPPPVLNAILHAVGLPSLDMNGGCTLFRVDAELQAGCWILLIAVLICEIVAHIIVELGEAAISERMAMLSAYHRAKNPLISPRRRSRRQAAFVEDEEAPTRTLRRLLNAQEVGAQNFVGSWFDFVYGPFPRRMWGALVCGFMKRVDWVEVGQDLHEDMVEVSDVDDEGSVSSTSSATGTTASAAAVQATANRHVLSSATESEQLLEQLLRSEDSESWMAESPAVRH